MRLIFMILFFSVTNVTVAHDCIWWWPVDPPAHVLREKITVLHGFQRCMTGPGGNPEGCCDNVYDVDGDGDIDLKDFAELEICINAIFDLEKENK